jgi:MoaA/NifB/PqqE/SkfB family radical SAM enzyme
MHLLLLTPQNKHKKCKTIPHTDKINTFPCSLLSKLVTQISRKLSLTPFQTYLSSDYKKVHSLTYYNPMVWEVTNIFKDTNTKISFRTNNTIRNKLNIRTHFTKSHTPSGIYQLQCQICDLSCIGQTCCRWNNDIKIISDISRPMNPSMNPPPPPHSPQ